MRKAFGVVCAAVVVCGVGWLWAAPAPANAPAGTEVLHEASPWRSHVVFLTPLVRVGADLREAGRSAYGGPNGWKAKTPFPPADWMAPEFDDAPWSGWSGRRGRGLDAESGISGAGGGSPVEALQCLRGRFLVADPAQVKDLRLTLTWRGGVVIYLNGKEIARANLPKSDTPDLAALAEDYPPETFVKADGRVINAEAGDTRKPENRERLAKRIRRLPDLAVPSALLPQGENLLAVEVHRAPQWGKGLETDDMNTVSVWSTCGLVSLSLRAGGGAAALDARVKGPEVWNASTLTRLAPGCHSAPGSKLRPMEMVGCRNGRFTGKVVVSSDGALRGVKATVTGLKAKDGKEIPVSAIKVLYTTRDDKMTMMKRAPASGFWDTLSDAPPVEVPANQTAGAFQAIWVKVAVPADATPGDYEGTLTVAAEGLAPTAVPVRLKVIDWRLPDPRDYVTHMGLVQSPESVALYYQLPLWSEEHWKRIEKSFQLMAEVGAKNVYLPLITKTNFGNSESMVRWVRKDLGVGGRGSGRGQDGQASPSRPSRPSSSESRTPTAESVDYTYDFTILDRYLDLAQKYLKPDVVVLYAWELRKYAFRLTPEEKARTANPVRVTLLDPATGQVTEMEGPNYKTPEAVGFWKPVLTEVKARLAKRGLGGAMMIGMAGDVQPTKDEVAMFTACLPGTRWVRNAHPDYRGGTLNGVPIGYTTAVYLSQFPPPQPWDAKRKAGWQLSAKADAFPRAGCLVAFDRLTPYGSLPLHRVFTEGLFMGNLSGLGRTGADFWPITGTRITEGEKRSTSIVGRYMEANWDQLNMDCATECLLAPGPDGAVTTERFELLREGVQDSEARAFIEKAILDGTLDAALAKKCQDLLDERQWLIRAACMGWWNWFEGPCSAGLAEQLYATAAEVAAAKPL